MKTIYLIRHAKSSWTDGNIKDFDRPLNSRGKNDAPIMGHRLFANNIIPDLMVSSSANRAISTARLIAEELKYPLNQIVEEQKIYHASNGELMRVIEMLPATASCIFLFGHNPTISTFVEELTNEYYGSLPTNGIVGIEFPVNQWIAISKGSGNVVYYDYPKKEI